MPSRHGNHPSDQPLKVGVLLVGDSVQFLDIAAVDLLAMMQKSYLKACELPEELANQGIDDIQWHIISEEDQQLHQTTAGLKVAVTDTIHTCPHLDILIIGGPPIDHVPHPHISAFISKQLSSVDALITVCAGYLPVLLSGILDGKTATAPKPLLRNLHKTATQVKWVEKRWATDEEGKIWTSGLVTNGLEMMAAFLRDRWGGEEGKAEVVETVLRLADCGGRGQEY